MPPRPTTEPPRRAVLESPRRAVPVAGSLPARHRDARRGVAPPGTGPPEKSAKRAGNVRDSWPSSAVSTVRKVGRDGGKRFRSTPTKDYKSLSAHYQAEKEREDT